MPESNFSHNPEEPQSPQGKYDRYYRAEIITNNSGRLVIGPPSSIDGQKFYAGIVIDPRGLPLPNGIKELVTPGQPRNQPEIHFNPGLEEPKAKIEQFGTEIVHAEPEAMNLPDIEELIRGVMERDWSHIRNRNAPTALTRSAVDGVMDALTQSGIMTKALRPDLLRQMLAKIEDPDIRTQWLQFRQDSAARHDLPKATLDYPEKLSVDLSRKIGSFDEQAAYETRRILNDQLLPAMVFPIAKKLLEKHNETITQLGIGGTRYVDLETYLAHRPSPPKHRGFPWPRRRRKD